MPKCSAARAHVVVHIGHHEPCNGLVKNPCLPVIGPWELSNLQQQKWQNKPIFNKLGPHLTHTSTSRHFWSSCWAPISETKKWHLGKRQRCINDCKGGNYHQLFLQPFLHPKNISCSSFFLAHRLPNLNKQPPYFSINLYAYKTMIPNSFLQPPEKQKTTSNMFQQNIRKLESFCCNIFSFWELFELPKQQTNAATRSVCASRLPSLRSLHKWTNSWATFMASERLHNVQLAGSKKTRWVKKNLWFFSSLEHNWWNFKSLEHFIYHRICFPVRYAHPRGWWCS